MHNMEPTGPPPHKYALELRGTAVLLLIAVLFLNPVVFWIWDPFPLLESYAKRIMASLALLDLILIVIALFFLNWKGLPRKLSTHPTLGRSILSFLQVIAFLLILVAGLEASWRVAGVLTRRGDNKGAATLEWIYNTALPQTDQYGFRTGPKQIKFDACPGSIVGIGASFTFGDGVDDYRKVWPLVVQDSLKVKFKKCLPVINAGVPGYTIREQKKRLTRSFKPYIGPVSLVHKPKVNKGILDLLKPSAVIFGYSIGELGPYCSNDPKQRWDWPEKLGLIHTLCYRYSHFYTWLFLRLRNLHYLKLGNNARKSKIRDCIVPSRHKNEKKPSAWRNILLDFEGIAQACDDRGIDLVVFIWPLMEGWPNNYPYADLHKIVYADLKKLSQKYPGLWVLDVLPDFKEQVRARHLRMKDLIIDKYDHHPSQISQGITGKAVADFLIKTGLARKWCKTKPCN